MLFRHIHQAAQHQRLFRSELIIQELATEKEVKRRGDNSGQHEKQNCRSDPVHNVLSMK